MSLTFAIVLIFSILSPLTTSSPVQVQPPIVTSDINYENFPGCTEPSQTVDFEWTSDGVEDLGYYFVMGDKKKFDMFTQYFAKDAQGKCVRMQWNSTDADFNLYDQTTVVSTRNFKCSLAHPMKWVLHAVSTVNPELEHYVHVVKMNNEKSWALAYLCLKYGTSWVVFSKQPEISNRDREIILAEARELGFDTAEENLRYNVCKN